MWICRMISPLNRCSVHSINIRSVRRLVLLISSSFVNFSSLLSLFLPYSRRLESNWIVVRSQLISWDKSLHSNNFSFVFLLLNLMSAGETCPSHSNIFRECRWMSVEMIPLHSFTFSRALFVVSYEKLCLINDMKESQTHSHSIRIREIRKRMKSWKKHSFQ